MDVVADERLSEYICDYVDGTMDPVVEEVFEEYMEQNTTVYNFVQQTLWSRNVLNQLPAYSASYNFNSEFHYRMELERQLDVLLDSEKKEDDQKTANDNLFVDLFKHEEDNKRALWMSLMCVMLMLLAASGYWLW